MIYNIIDTKRGLSQYLFEAWEGSNETSQWVASENAAAKDENQPGPQPLEVGYTRRGLVRALILDDPARVGQSVGEGNIVPLTAKEGDAESCQGHHRPWMDV
jgi:hypothetical protein